MMTRSARCARTTSRISSAGSPSLFLALIILSWTIAVRAWSTLDAEPPLPVGWLMRGFGIVSILAGALLGLAWTAQLVPIAVSGVVGPEYLDSPSAFWTIRIVDLGFITPIALWTGVGLWRRQATVIKAAYGLASFLTLQGASVLAMGMGMGMGMHWRADPTANPGFVYALAPIAVAVAVLTVRLLGSYAGGSISPQVYPVPAGVPSPPSTETTGSRKPTSPVGSATAS